MQFIIDDGCWSAIFSDTIPLGLAEVKIELRQQLAVLAAKPRPQ